MGLNMDYEQMNEFLKTTPETLAKNQYRELKAYALDRIKEVYKLLERDELDTLETLLDDSPAGDGYGSDNMYISFGKIFSKDLNADIGEVIYKLRKLKGD